jgi:hypothetical protein
MYLYGAGGATNRKFEHGAVWTYLHDLIQTVRDIRSLQVMNMYQLITMYLNGKKNMAKKVLLQ